MGKRFLLIWAGLLVSAPAIAAVSWTTLGNPGVDLWPNDFEVMGPDLYVIGSEADPADRQHYWMTTLRYRAGQWSRSDNLRPKEENSHGYLLHRDRSGDLVTASSRRSGVELRRLDAGRDVWETLSFSPSLNGLLADLAFDSANVPYLLVAGSAGNDGFGSMFSNLFRFDPTVGNWSAIDLFVSGSVAEGTRLLQSSAGALFGIGHYNRLISGEMRHYWITKRLNPSQRKWEVVDVIENPEGWIIPHAIAEKAGAVYVAGGLDTPDNGAWLIRKSTDGGNSFVTHARIPVPSDLTPSIYDFLVDDSGCLWVAGRFMNRDYHGEWVVARIDPAGNLEYIDRPGTTLSPDISALRLRSLPDGRLAVFGRDRASAPGSKLRVRVSDSPVFPLER